MVQKKAFYSHSRAEIINKYFSSFGHRFEKNMQKLANFSSSKFIDSVSSSTSHPRHP